MAQTINSGVTLRALISSKQLTDVGDIKLRVAADVCHLRIMCISLFSDVGDVAPRNKPIPPRNQLIYAI